MIRWFIIIGALLIFGTANAQQIITARVFENKTRIALPGVNVRNITTKQTTVTGTDGKFNIKAAANDVLVLTSFNYETDSVLITDLKEKEIFLEPKGNMLKEVKVKASEVNTGSMMDPEFHGQTVVYSRNADGSYKGGVTFRIPYSKNNESKHEKDQQVQHDEAVKQEIAKVFSSQTISKYINLKPEEMNGFIIRYIPTAKVYQSSGFNLLNYINTCYKQYIKLPPEKRIADKLTSPL
jgi:hypothetical protein